MSGNPFRTSLHQKHVPTASAPHYTSIDHADTKSFGASGLDTSDSEYASQLPAKTKKSVRIESTASPPHPASHDAQDDTLRLRIEQQRLAVPPPLTSPAGFSDNFEDSKDHPPGKDVEEGDDVYEAREVTGSTRRHSDMLEAPISLSGAPPNPFSRTLATIELREQGGRELGHTAGLHKDRSAAERTTPGTTRLSLDVESFKNLLMTGIKNPKNPGSTAPIVPATGLNPVNASLLESSSSTDTSSISRQSIFEPVHEQHTESSRTSYDMAASDDDERAGLIDDAKKTEKKKPPPPRHRHGKPVPSRTPQIVSFSDFSVTQPVSTPISRNRTDSDLNKPLPLPPVLSPTINAFPQASSPDGPLPLETRISGSPIQSDITPTQKKIPPPVPLARRQSQLRSSTIGNRSRSNSSLTMSSHHSTDLSLLSPGANTEPTASLASQKAPPPPPPSRRHGTAMAGINTPSANSSTTELPSTASTHRTPLSSPNPPSSRRPTFSSPPPSPGPTRASSVRSNINPRSISNDAATMPPPPPPPRRRQSGRSSLDKERPSPLPTSSPEEGRRTSSENKRTSFDSKRRTSVASESSLRHEYARKDERENEQVLYSPMEEGLEATRGLGLQQANNDSSNILDDMEKFQREIDELRARYNPAA